MGLLESLFAAAMQGGAGGQGSAGAQGGAGAPASPVAGALMALLGGGGGMGADPSGADQLRPPPGGIGALGGLASGLMGGGAPASAAMRAGAQEGGALAAGLAALVQQFTQGGYGQQASSWVGTGANMPIDPQAVASVVGNDRLAMLANRYGIPHAELAAALAQHLPEAVNSLTPQGAVPGPEAMQQLLSRFLGGGSRGDF